MHWTERREAKANLGTALRSLGWELFGWKDDDSDPMTDYYSPPSWGGIARKGDALAIVDIRDAGEEYQPTHTVPVKVADCPRCKGSGVEDTFWTLQKAQEKPKTYNEWKTRTDPSLAGTVDLFPTVVSPLGFDSETQRPHCFGCRGTGETRRAQEEPNGPKIPAHKGNPPRRKWHVERAGKVLASGVGLSACVRRNGDSWKEPPAGAVALAQKIDQAATGAPRRAAEPSEVSEPTLTRNEAHNGLELHFPGRPSDEVLEQMGQKRKGGRGRWTYHRARHYWYTKQSAEALQEAEHLLRLASGGGGVQ